MIRVTEWRQAEKWWGVTFGQVGMRMPTYEPAGMGGWKSAK